MKFSLTKSLLEVSRSGEASESSRRCSSAPTALLTALLFLRSAWCRAYRLPPCALINLSHGSRAEHASPRPAAAGSFQAQRQLGSLNHSPRSPFIPTQVREEAEVPPSSLTHTRSDVCCSAPLQHNKQGAMKAGSQGSRNSPSEGLTQKHQARVRLSSSHPAFQDGAGAEPSFSARTRRCTATCGRLCRTQGLLTNHPQLTGTTT